MSTINEQYQKHRKQVIELQELLESIKGQVRTKQVKGMSMPEELLLLMGYMNREEATLLWNVRMLDSLDDATAKPLQEDIQNKMQGFRETYNRALQLLPAET